jgi:hypothetical protein
MWIVAVGFQNCADTNKPVSPAVFICKSEHQANREYNQAIKDRRGVTMRYVSMIDGKETIVKDSDNEY